MRIRRGRTALGIGGVVALTVALLGGTAPALAAPAQGPHRAGGLAIDPTRVSPGYRPPRTSAPVYRAASIPASVDLTAFAPPAGDQGPDGSCVSWGTGYTTMGWWARKAGDATKVFAPMYLYSQTHLTDGGDGGGSYPSANYAILQSQGIDAQSDWTGDSSTFSRTPNAAEQAAAAQFRTGAYHVLFSSGQAETGVGAGAQAAIEQALANGYPVGIGMPVYDAFYDLDASHSTYLLSDPGSTTDYQGGHYVVAVGYDATGVIIENSWGSSWGDQGFATIGWDFVDAKAVEAEYLEGPLEYTTAQRAPGAITGFGSPTQDSSSIDLSWTPPADTGSTPISSYTLTTSGGGTSSTIVLAGGATTAHVAGLDPSTAYTFALTAANTLNLVSPTVSTTSTTEAAPAPVVQPTATPTPVSSLTPTSTVPVLDLMPTEPVVSTPPPTPVVAKPIARAPSLGRLAVRVGRTTLKLRWTAAKANSGSITKYRIVVTYRGRTMRSRTFSAHARAATLTGLKPTRTYHLVVYAYNSAGKVSRRSTAVETG